MRRAFDIDVLACPRCGGRLRLIATVEDADAIRAILVAGTGSRELADREPPSPRPVRSCRGGGSPLWAQRPVAQQKSLDRPIVRAVHGGNSTTDRLRPCEKG